jgi:pyridoxamine 5'-phosphate oxidase
MDDVSDSAEAGATGAAATPRALLRSLKALAGPFEPFDPAEAAATPQEEFLAWLGLAIASGAAEPHAMTVSTLGEDGLPDARLLLLKDLDHRGWHFATSRRSAKGRQLAADPRAALTFYWPGLGRQVRIRGEAVDLGKEAGAADFRARGLGARAVALLERQSDPLPDPAELGRAVERRLADLESAPDTISHSWAVYAVRPLTVEFWQADVARRHIRLLYTRDGAGWIKGALWP